MSTAVVKSEGGQLNLYDPEKGLQSIAVSDAAIKHFARAKDASQLLKAMESKLTEIRKFVLWWDKQDKHPGSRKGAAVAELRRPVAGKDGLPDRYEIERWRKKTKDEKAFQQALDDAKHRAQRIGDLQAKGTERGTAGTGEFERYTPAEYITLARAVLGSIDLDPATRPLRSRAWRRQRRRSRRGCAPCPPTSAASGSASRSGGRRPGR